MWTLEHSLVDCPGIQCHFCLTPGTQDRWMTWWRRRAGGATYSDCERALRWRCPRHKDLGRPWHRGLPRGSRARARPARARRLRGWGAAVAVRAAQLRKRSSSGHHVWKSKKRSGRLIIAVVQSYRRATVESGADVYRRGTGSLLTLGLHRRDPHHRRRRRRRCRHLDSAECKNP